MKGDLVLVPGVHGSFQASNQKVILVPWTEKITGKENGADNLLYVSLLLIC